MDAIKVRKQLLVIELKDWTVLHSEKTMDELDKYLSECWPRGKIDGILFNVYEFKKAYEKKADDISVFKMSLPKEDQDIIKAREVKMKELWKHWTSIEQIQKYIESKRVNP